MISGRISLATRSRSAETAGSGAAAWIDADGEMNAATARGAVMRNYSPVTMMPLESSRVASVAINTIGSFFG